MDLFDVKGWKAIVTGGTRGLGNGIAEILLESGVKTVIIGSNDSVFEKAESYVSSGYDCIGIKCDLSDGENRKQGFESAVKALGGLDIMVNAAGIISRYPCEEYPLSEWDKVIEVNLKAPFEFSQLAAKEFLKKDVPYGKIVNIASMHSFGGGYTVTAYAASKGGVAQFSKGMSNELACKGINVNCIAPGFMATDMNKIMMRPDNPRSTEILSRIPAKRWGSIDDIKGLALFLCSHASDYINGTVIPCDGGYLAR